ncbi:DinB family protein [Streptomyces litchfieldiae]|uniref:DinB family protein n=1 Tax=Streptomyces litchfieldiae TaxID=3075543 RepID=A0ABU2MJC9_9ACTN|nr:DinB family protein [Streptomyces sp. DSM 44938]MDT0341689.1 DinB family protein [Streptomyces sp. DSM 44938]
MVRHVPFTGSEKECLRAALDRHRDVVLWKLEGLDDEQARRVVTPLGNSLLGLVKHLGGAELGWFCLTFGRETGPLPFDPAVGDGSDLRVGAGESVQDVVDFYVRARGTADRAIDALDLDDLGTAFAFFGGATVSLRWALVHMLEETVRHAGHMDIVRELVDGATGDHRGD